jgi:hypothetical protein
MSSQKYYFDESQDNKENEELIFRKKIQEKARKGAEEEYFF